MIDDIVNLPIRSDGRIKFSSPFFAQRRNYKHLGTDFGAQTPGVSGDDVVVATPGKLVFRGKAGNYGQAAVIERDNGDGTYSYFLNAHLVDSDPSTKAPSAGEDIKAGQTIGQMGNTGTSANKKPIPVHGHFEQTNTNGKLDFSTSWPLGKGPVGVTPSGVAWERVGPSFQLPNGWVAKSDNGRISVTAPPMQATGAQQNLPAQPFQHPDPGDRRHGNQASAPSTAQPADASSSFEDRFSAIYNSPPARAGNFAGQGIPFVPRPAGSLSTPGEPTFLNPTPISPVVAAPFAAGTQFIPGSLSPRPLYPTGKFVTPPTVPNSSSPQNNKRSDIPDVIMPTLAQPAPPSGLTPASADANASASLFSRLMSAGPDSLLAADDTASRPLQPDATPDTAGNSQTRFLVGRPYDPSQGSPFAARPAPSQPSPDGSLSLNGAYLEYLRRLNAV